jgi:hypothetical protein
MPTDAGDILNISARFKTSAGNDIMNVFNLLHASGSTTSDAQIMDMVEDWLDSMYSPLASALWSDMDPYDFKVDVVELQSGKFETVHAVGTRSWVLTTNPSGATDSMAPGCCAVVNFRSTRPKSFGRKFLGIMQESVQNGGVLVGSFLTQLGTFAAQMLAGEVAGGTGAIFAAVIKSTLSPTGYWELTEAVVSDIVGYQRRRRQGTGS